MRRFCEELENSDESDDWETVPNLDVDGCIVTNDWLRLNSLASKSTYATDELTDCEQSTPTEKAVDLPETNPPETTSAEQQLLCRVDDEDDKASNPDCPPPLQTTDDECIPSTLDDATDQNEANDGEILLSDEAELEEGAKVAWMLRHVQLSSVARRSVPGIVCVLSIAIFGISHYIYIHQAGNYSNIHVISPPRDRVQRHNKHNVCRLTNTSFIESMLFNEMSNGKEANDSQVPSSAAYCNKLEALYVNAQKQNVQLKQVVSRLQKRLVRMSSLAQRWRMQRLALTNNIKSTTLNYGRTANNEDIRNVDEPSHKWGISMVRSLNASIERLQAVVRRLGLATNRPEERTPKKMSKRLQKITMVLSNAVKSFVNTVEVSLGKLNRPFLSSSVLKAPSGFKNSLTVQNQVASNSVYDDKPTVQKQQKKKRKSKKKKLQSISSGDQAAQSCSSKPESKVNWLFDAYEQRQALRGMPYVGDSQNPSWLIRRWNKRGSLRQQYL